MKCGDCGDLIPPRRGYCIRAECHNKRLGGDKPDLIQIRKGRNREGVATRKMCPFCSGTHPELPRHLSGRTCWVALCDRGPNGARCGCHYQMTGMYSPGPEGHLLKKQGINARSFARVVA